jgi:hypothetical protein
MSARMMRSAHLAAALTSPLVEARVTPVMRLPHRFAAELASLHSRRRP